MNTEALQKRKLANQDQNDQSKIEVVIDDPSEKPKQFIKKTKPSNLSKKRLTLISFCCLARTIFSKKTVKYVSYLILFLFLVLIMMWLYFGNIMHTMVQERKRDGKRVDFLSNIGTRRLISYFYNPWTNLHPTLDQYECTIGNKKCFDFKNCKGDKLTIAIYPDTEKSVPVTLIDRTRLQPTSYYKQIRHAIRTSPYYTRDVNNACLIFPNVDHTLTNSETDAPYAISSKLKRLDYWKKNGNGRNFLLFSMHDFPGIEYDAGYAIVAKCGFSVSHFRPQFDVSIPPVSLWFIRNLQTINELPKIRENGYFKENEKYLMTFKGGFSYKLRSKLVRDFHDPKRKQIIIHKSNDSYDYKDLLVNTIFALTPRGNGYFSYRSVEAMAAGSIPIILADLYVLPFEEIINWKEISIIVPEDEYKKIPFIITQLSSEDIRIMRCKIDYIYTNFFSSTEQHVHWTLAILEERIITKKKTNLDDELFSKYVAVESNKMSQAFTRCKELVYSQRHNILKNE